MAEWPPRQQDSSPDPSAVIDFRDADPLFARCEHAKKPAVLAPDPANYGFQCPIPARHHGELPSVAVAPLVCAGVTTGLLGLVNLGKRTWSADEIDALEAIACLFAQLQARIGAENKLKYLADHDELTGVHNRRALIAELGDRLRPGRPGPVAVLYIDLDRLKSVNDYLGHSAGDLFIRVFAQRLSARVGSLGMIARIGGDEFVLAPSQPMSPDDATSFARRVQSMMGNRVLIRGELITRTVSIGVAVGLPGHDNCAELLRRGDQAVLSAKRAGGNRIAAFTDTMLVTSAFRNDVEFGLQGVVDSDSLLVNYLPEVDMRTGDIVAAEALVRWRHPTHGLLMPDSFVGIAESLNLAEELSRRVMRTAFAEFSRWRSRGAGQSVMLRLNVSPAQLVADGFVRSVVSMIGEFGVDASSVCFEITERAIVLDIEATRQTLAELKDAGFQIGIDDFGTGYAVLSHLKTLPIDMLKIDKGFVRELGTNAGD
ncbi:MAG: putative bifunctional diguanylate cyclase/phosphodiesterase, partial [Mycobacterium sp.]